MIKRTEWENDIIWVMGDLDRIKGGLDWANFEFKGYWATETGPISNKNYTAYFFSFFNFAKLATLNSNCKINPFTTLFISY